MEMEIKMNVVPDNQILVNGINALKDSLGVIDTLRFLEQFDNGGTGDYTKEKYMQEDKPLTKEEILHMFYHENTKKTDSL